MSRTRHETHCSTYFYNVQLEEGQLHSYSLPVKLLIQDLQETWINGLVILIIHTGGVI